MVLAAGIMIAMQLLSAAPESLLIEASGQGNIDFRVFYIENDLFPDNPVPRNLLFFRHLTDFIEIESSFNAVFSEDFHINYSYIAEKRFQILYTGSGVGNPVVFEEITEISRVANSTFGNRLNFNSSNEPGQPGGTYIIRPNDFLETYMHFLEYNERVLGDAGGGTFRGFTADLVIEFRYTVNSHAAGINESVRRGYRIPISTNVFTVEPFGTAGFTSSVAAVRDTEQVSAIVLGALCLAVIIGAVLIVIGLKSGSRQVNPRRKEYESILKKYSNEVIISGGIIDLSKLTVMPVATFDELLKLSLNLSKIIICHKDHERAVFCVIMDGHAFCHVIEFQKKKIHVSIADESNETDNESGKET